MNKKRIILLSLIAMLGLTTITAQKTVVSKNKPVERVLDTCEQMPQFGTDNAELFKFLQENVKYPEDAAKSKIQGRVVVEFVVDKEGNIKDPTIMRSAYPSLDAEALRVVKSMPRWTPGYQDGQPVNVKYALPIVFKLK
jgi:protein TonB